MTDAEAEQRIREAEATGAIDLDLSDLGLSTLPSTILRLKNLIRLDLSGNNLRTLPPQIGQLRSLRALNLTKNPAFRRFPREIGLLTSLQQLFVGPCELTELPAEFGQLRNLALLILFTDKLRSLPEEFGNLTQLTHVAIRSEALEKLPNGMRDFAHLEQLRLEAPLGIPAEILGNQMEPQAILDYYFRSRRGPRPLNEAKLIVVGRGAVGKTSLIKRLVDRTFDENEPETPGIEIRPWEIKADDGDNVRLHLWDFGGQEILHATHQFFLTERSIYIVVLTGREGSPTYDAEYWLQLIRSFGRGSPVIIALNKQKQHPFDVNRGLLLEKYPEIAGFVAIDCKQTAAGAVARAGSDSMGIRELRRLLVREITDLEHRKVSFPADWFAIKDRFAGMRENFVAWDKFQEICRDLGEQDPAAQRSLAEFLHVLGIALNYRNDLRLRDTHVLNPRWVTEGIYALLRAGHRAPDARGVLTPEDVATALDEKSYPPESHQFLVSLMERFQLCFPVPGQPGRVLVPELLSENQPEEISGLAAEAGLGFRYQYEVLPEGLLPRFIVQTHTYSETNPQWRWRTGVVLDREGCTGVVRADARERRVDINVTGARRRRKELLTIIRERFHEQHRDLAGLTVDERVPLPDEPNVTVSYNFLLQLEEEGEEWCRPEGSRQKLRVVDLLDGIETAEQRAERREQDKLGWTTHLTSKQHAFLSYLRENQAEVEQLRGDLMREGERIWWDGDILGGQEWQQTIRRAMRNSYAVIVCLSSELEARIRSNVYPEVLAAIGEYRQQAPGNVFLIPVKLNECGIPDIEIDATRTLDHIETINLYPPAHRPQGIQRLLKSLRAAPLHP